MNIKKYENREADKFDCKCKNGADEIVYSYTGTFCFICFGNIGREVSGRDLIREKVRRRDKHTCQDCKKVWGRGMRRFDIHHLNGLCGKKSRKYDRVSEMDNLITLCHKCHFNRPEHPHRTKNRRKRLQINK